MPILTFSNGRKKYVLRRISSQQIIGRNLTYPTATDDSEIVGLDPDLEYLAMDQDVIPDYDPRIYVLTTTELRNAVTTPPTWHITFGTVKRTVTEIKANAINVEAVKNRLHFTEQERDKLVILGLAVLFRQTANQQLTQREVALKNRIITMGTAIWNNDQRLRDIMVALDGGGEPDLDDQWAPAPSP